MSLLPQPPSTFPTPVNVAGRLTAFARAMPDAPAVIVAARSTRFGRRPPLRFDFRRLDEDSDHVARGIVAAGVAPGTRLVLLVPPSYEFVMLVFALLKAGAVSVLIDPGMGREHLLRCLQDVDPHGFVAVSRAQAVRAVLRGKFPQARFQVTVGRRWFWGGWTLDGIRQLGRSSPTTTLPSTSAHDPAAIIFTTGSTGPPKGVLYRHGNFDCQVSELEATYQLRPGAVDLACFPLFGLFNAALGVTTVIPDMDSSRPASVDPRKIVGAIREFQVTQSFASPAVWERVGQYCAESGIRLPGLARIFSAGAPVSPDVLRAMRSATSDAAELHTPYGATEALPVATIESRELFAETEAASRRGAGTCVGRRFPGIAWRVIQIVDGPIARIADAKTLPTGALGELIVRGPVVTAEYVTRTKWNALSKIPDGEGFWHRMGDAGYLDEQDRFWYCGRVAHRVHTSQGVLESVPCEAIFNEHPRVRRAALVGVGEKGQQRAVICVEPRQSLAALDTAARETLLAELRDLGQANPLTQSISTFLLHASFPVDIRHNAKIFREKLADWATLQLKKGDRGDGP